MKSILILFLFLTGITAFTSAQVPLFRSEDRVSFLGNSITMSGSFHNYIELFYVTRFPKIEVSFNNNGISGDVAEGMLSRLRTDVLINKPAWCMVMAGMNDVKRGLYAAKFNDDPDAKQRRNLALENYFKNMDSLVMQLMNAGIKVVLQTPTIYDQTANTSTENYKGVNDALGQCADFIRSLGEKYKLPIVDYWSAMNNVNATVQKINPSASIIGRDRVHPGIYGHFLMAATFLKAQGVPSVVSNLTINAKKRKTEYNIQGTVALLQGNSKGLSFTWEAEALPFPLLSENFKPDSLFAFTDELNKEMLKIRKLKKGMYSVIIDSVEVGQYSSQDLKEGINLSINIRTPQYIQAGKVLTLLQEYWKLERRLRQIRYVEYQLLPIGAKNDPTFFDVNLKRRTDKIMVLLKDRPEDETSFYRRNLDEYIVNKPRAKELQDEADALYKLIQMKNKPVRHFYSVVPVK